MKESGWYSLNVSQILEHSLSILFCFIQSIKQSEKASTIILTWLRGNHDHQGGSSRARPFHCTKDGLTLAINPNVINSGVQFLVVGDCVRAVPWTHYKCKKNSCHLPEVELNLVPLVNGRVDRLVIREASDFLSGKKQQSNEIHV